MASTIPMASTIHVGEGNTRGFKSMLYEYCSKKKLGVPYFDTSAVTGEVESGFQSQVTVAGTAFDQGGVCRKKKDAENEAAKISLDFLVSAQNDAQVSTEEGDSGKKPKSRLHEYCQKVKFAVPQYETTQVTASNKLLGYTCVLTVNNIAYSNNSTFPNKREAEHFMAAKALAELNPGGASSSPYSPSKASPGNTMNGISFKNLLQEHLHQRSLDRPVYDTQLSANGYKSSVVIEGKLVECLEACASKKLAEQSAAKAGLIELGIKDPEAVALKLMRRRSKGHLQFPGLLKTRIPGGNEKETWIHARMETSFDTDICDGANQGYIDFQKNVASKKRSLDSSDDDTTPTKKQKVSESPDVAGRPEQQGTRRLRKRDNEYDVEDVHLGNLSVGERWPEKRNVVVVGSEETSIPLYCIGEQGRCALQEKKTTLVVDVLPGHRLIGLEGRYVERGGHIVLLANKCEEIMKPIMPDRVLVSCGVVVLHCIPRDTASGKSCDINILLKRYLCSQPFVNVVRGMAQYFRQKLFDRPVTLIPSSIVIHISKWMLEEVMALASMTEEAVRNVFRHTMKFDKRWTKVLEAEELPQELKEIKALAEEELKRRAMAQEDQNEDRFRPWHLPKGNFYHRILSTGVFVESPAECAMRELREETGIRLKLHDIAMSPYVDLPQTDNLNPHQGDVARYYLCGIITEDEDLTEGTNQEQPIDEPMENTNASDVKTEIKIETEFKTPDKSTGDRDANLIRSPSVAGALHEECTWHDVDSARKSSHVFSNVYNTPEFQNLMSNLKRIVLAM